MRIKLDTETDIAQERYESEKKLQKAFKNEMMRIKLR